VSGNDDGTVWHLRIQEDDLGPALLLRLEGRVYHATSSEVARALDRCCAGVHRAVLLDFSAVDYINGRGLSLVEAAAARLRAAGRQLIVFGLCPVVEAAFGLSGALAHVTVEPSRESALRRIDPKSA
jgi:anti-anti-sigma factor